MNETVIDVVSLYQKDMNIYGDSGNVLTIRRRLELYGYEPRIHMINQNDPWPDHVDMILGGGGQDTGQKKITRDLFRRADLLCGLAADGMPMLMICGMYQLFGEYFETSEGERLNGLGIIGAYTVGKSTRLVGNLVEKSDEFGEIIGYENHSGQTFLRDDNVIGTYMHGSLLPKNPAIADFLIAKAAERRYGSFDTSRQSTEQADALRHLDKVAEAARHVAASRPR